MGSIAVHRRTWLLVLLALILIAFGGHLVGDAVPAASADYVRLELSAGCLHTELLLHIVPALMVGLIPGVVLMVAPPIPQGQRVPALMHPPTQLLLR